MFPVECFLLRLEPVRRPDAVQIAEDVDVLELEWPYERASSMRVGRFRGLHSFDLRTLRIARVASTSWDGRRLPRDMRVRLPCYRHLAPGAGSLRDEPPRNRDLKLRS